MLVAKRLITAFVLSGLFVPSVAIALKLDYAIDKNTGLIHIGPVTVYPSMKIVTRYDDNLFLSDKNELSTAIVIVSQAAEFVLQDNIKKLTLDYEIETGLHENSSQDNYTDKKIHGVFVYHPTDRIITELRAQYRDEHDNRGTGRTEGGVGTLDPDEWHSYGIGGLVGYGTPNATGRIEIEANFKTKVYDNNRQFTFSRDRDETYLRGAFFYRIRPKTRLLFEIKQTEFEYEKEAIGVPSLDNINRDYLFGASWDATFQTTGFAKFGITEKVYDSNLRTDTINPKWEIGVRWKPRSYSTVDITTVRRQDETDGFTDAVGFGDSVDVSEFKISWNHIWRERFTSTVDFLSIEADHSGTGRQDEGFTTGLKFNYDFRRWMTLSAGYQYEENDSNVSTFSYQRNIFNFTMDFTL